MLIAFHCISLFSSFQVKLIKSTCDGYLVAKSCPTLAIPWTVARQARLFMGFSKQEYWSVLPCPPPGNLPNPGLPHCRWILYQLSHQGSQEYWNGWPIPSPGDLPSPGIEPGSPALQAGSLPAEVPWKPQPCVYTMYIPCVFLLTHYLVFYPPKYFVWKLLNKNKGPNS